MPLHRLYERAPPLPTHLLRSFLTEGDSALPSQLNDYATDIYTSMKKV